MKKEIAKALKEARKGKPRNFTQSVELAITLQNLDFKKPDSRVKGDVVLPHGRGKSLKIGAFAEGDMGVRARKAGLKVFSKKDIQSLSEDKKKAKKIVSEHEFFIAQTDLMPLVGKT
ncbi:MAG: 50S ribosomal protein L1, partial [Candidatus Methanofastidiosia archaeon]